MIEIKVPAKERVIIKFGLNEGVTPLGFNFTEEELTRIFDQSSQVDKLNATIRDLTRVSQQQMDEIKRLARELQEARGSYIQAGSPLYVIDSQLAEMLKRLAFAAGEWQPIDTAPKDGTGILLFCSADLIVHAGHWHSRLGAWYVSGQGPMPSTHWMPLPEPPKA